MGVTLTDGRFERGEFALDGRSEPVVTKQRRATTGGSDASVRPLTAVA
ncbi:hypothetical protein [Natronorubrum halophilum]|nr:hypothetical protein [Natronorubrum halophilum]